MFKIVSSLYVYNRDGASQCGVMCAAWNLLDMLRAAQEVDIFYTVRYIRLYRRQFIETMVGLMTFNLYFNQMKHMHVSIIILAI